jgi:GntR family transcriptional regulator
MIEFRLSPDSGVPIYRQIQDQVWYGVALGLFRPGEQLPTVRALAVELAVNPNTVIKAYAELERDGVITTEQGSGTFVAPWPAVEYSAAERRRTLDGLCVEFLAQAARHGFTARELLASLQTLLRRRAES